MPSGGRRYGPDGKLLGGRPRKAATVDNIQVKRNGDVLVPAGVAHQVAQIKQLETGPSPGDMLLQIARYHMGEAAREQARATAANAPAINRDLVRTELALAREAAKAAAPFCHRKLAAVAHTNPDGSALDSNQLAAILGKLPEEQLEQFERILAAIAAAAGLPGSTAGRDTAGPAATSH